MAPSKELPESIGAVPVSLPVDPPVSSPVVPVSLPGVPVSEPGVPVSVPVEPVSLVVPVSAGPLSTTPASVHPGIGTKTQPLVTSHESVVHGSLSSHVMPLRPHTPVDGSHVGVWHASDGQTLATCVQAPVVLHASTVHPFLSSQSTAGCLHAPRPSQRSSVQGSPSPGHALPAGELVPAHTPRLLHESLLVHEFRSSHAEPVGSGYETHFIEFSGSQKSYLQSPATLGGHFSVLVSATHVMPVPPEDDLHCPSQIDPEPSSGLHAVPLAAAFAVQVLPLQTLLQSLFPVAVVPQSFPSFEPATAFVQVGVAIPPVPRTMVQVPSHSVAVPPPSGSQGAPICSAVHAVVMDSCTLPVFSVLVPSPLEHAANDATAIEPTKVTRSQGRACMGASEESYERLLADEEFLLAGGLVDLVHPRRERLHREFEARRGIDRAHFGFGPRLEFGFVARGQSAAWGSAAAA